MSEPIRLRMPFRNSDKNGEWDEVFVTLPSDYLAGCLPPGTDLSEILPDPQHPFEQVEGATDGVCVCGKGPDHHVHGSFPDTCGCDTCRGQKTL